MCVLILTNIVIYLIYRVVVVKEENYQQQVKNSLPNLDNSKILNKDSKMFYCQFDSDAGVYWQEPGPEYKDLNSGWNYSGCDGYSNWGLTNDKKPKKCLNRKNNEISFNDESLFSESNKKLLSEMNSKKVGHYQLGTQKKELDNIHSQIKNFSHKNISSDNEYCKVFSVSNYKNDITELAKLKKKSSRSKDEDQRLFYLHDKINKNKSNAFNKCKTHSSKKYLFDRFNPNRINKKCLRNEICDPSPPPS